MVDFFNNQENPFASMMSMMEDEETETEAEAEESMEMMNPLMWMQQAWMMHMQMMQFMWMMPMQLMSGAMEWMSQNTPAEDSAAVPAKNEAAPEGFKLGNITVPPELLKKLMEMDMTPENLAKLQKLLDFAFAAMPKAEKE